MVTSLYESKNRCYSRSRIAEAKFRQIIRFFAMDFTASDTAKLTNISVRSIHTIYIKLHKKIAVQCEKISPFNGIKSFWGYAKKRLIKFNGIDKKMFYLHLKETEYRLNHRHDNLYLDLLKLLRNNPL